MTETRDDQKQRAIDIHTEQADLFRRRYEDLEQRPYGSTFIYGRRKTGAVIDRHMPQSGIGIQVLDAGCGSGYTLHQLAGRGFICAGLDASSKMVEHAVELNPGVDIRLGDVEALPYDDNSFDYLISIEVIRYLSDPARAVQEFRRVIRPGGTALVTAMPPLSLTGYALANRLTSRRQIGNFSRVRQYFHSVGQLERLFRGCGFERVTVEAVFWGPWAAGQRIAPGLLPRALRLWEPVDNLLTHVPAARNFSNHLIVTAVRGG